MGWGDCGLDSKGRPIGYVHPATCDHPDCDEKIDRGLSYACGDMHGETEHGCEKYFCSEHRDNVIDDGDRIYNVCDCCAKELIKSGGYIEDEMEGALVPNPNQD